MARLAQYLINASFIVVCSLQSCKNENTATIYLNIDSVSIQTRTGQTLCNGSPCTAMIYRLAPATLDTIETAGYQNGREHGLFREYYANGSLKSIRKFDQGKKIGTYRSWWPNGNMQSEYAFIDDEYEGSCKDWDENGLLIRSKNYKHGHEAGLQQMWQSDGKLWANYEVRNGRNYGITGIKGCATIWQGDSVLHR
jgi:hypothetical protein